MVMSAVFFLGTITTTITLETRELSPPFCSEWTGEAVHTDSYALLIVLALDCWWVMAARRECQEAPVRSAQWAAVARGSSTCRCGATEAWRWRRGLGGKMALHRQSP